MSLLNTSFLGNTLFQWLGGGVIGLITYGLLWTLSWLLRKKTARISQPSQLNASVLIKRLVDRTSRLFFAWIAIYMGLRFINMSAPVVNVIETLTIIILLIQLGFWTIEIIEFWVSRRLVSKEGELASQKAPLAAVSLLSKILVWSIVLILVLENIPGIHVTTLIASLGIGGIAIGLAVQKILGDLFASLTISIDQPFVVGDAINIDDFSGEVEHVGLKSTRIRSTTGEQLIFSNTDLLESRIRNFKRMEHRLITFTINVTYQTSYEKLKQIPTMIQRIVEDHPQAKFLRAHFKKFDDSALVFEVVYSINTADFNLYMDAQQEINLEIYRKFQEEGIHFAYPTQTILLNKKKVKG